MATIHTKKMLAVLRRHRKEFLKFPGIHYVDVGLKYVKNNRMDKVCIRFHVYKKMPGSLLQSFAIPREIEGYETDVVVSLPRLQDRAGIAYAQLEGGIEIQNPFLEDRGTLGAFVYDSNNNICGLTNHHVLFGDGGVKGNPVVQPVSPQAKPEDIIGELADGNKAFDCAIFKLNNSRPFLPDEVGLAGAIRHTIEPDMHQKVIKSGITTEVTYGIVEGLGTDRSFTISIDHDNPPADNLLCFYGDSGSVWLLNNGQNDTAVGLHFGGDANGTSGKAYSINSVLKSLNCSFTKK